MKIKSIFSKSFAKYGKVLTGYDVKDLLTTPQKSLIML